MSGRWAWWDWESTSRVRRSSSWFLQSVEL